LNDLLGRTAGPYRLESVIGRGPTGDVYRGAHLSTAQQVAVKALHASIAVGVEFPERFIADMQAVLSLRHPNVVTVYDFGVADGVCFIAMEVAHAGSVRALLRRRPPTDPVPLPLATDLICQAAEGLAYAHERGVIHKDIRPSNLLLDDAEESPDDDDETYALKITDFGLAQLAGGGSEVTSAGVTLGSGLMLGAPAYMSPEQCRGGELDGRSDLYSLGVVLYEMLTGMLPFPGARLEDTARERLFAPPPLPRLLNPEIPSSLEYVLLRCLAKQAEDRFETALDLAHAVRAAVSAV
jgi:serine/threonine protein kinase